MNSIYEDIGNELNLGLLNSVKIIETLWSNYGEIVRLSFKNKSIIVKHIKLPKNLSHPRGWNTNLSHQRKIKSYEIEVNWYKEFSTNIDNRCRVPIGLKTFKTNSEWLIVMEDLSFSGYAVTTMKANKNHLKSCISWLANFHAKYMNVKSDLLWEIGTYWHLDTRPDELKVLADKRLKYYAKELDNKLKNSKYQTIVHGDAKLANFCFNHDGSKCAAVDFQYVGHGCGMKDLIYFMSSAINPEDCEEKESWVIDTYFNELANSLKFYKVDINILDIESEWRPLYYFAWADFQRFIKGWNPKHYKINYYTESLTLKVLKEF